jgi:hypothetical protein
MGTEDHSGWQRWVAAEQDNRDDEADDALRGVFRAVPMHLPSDHFAAGVAEQIARAAARQARIVKVAFVSGGLLATVITVALLPYIPRLVRALLDLSVRAIVWTIFALERGRDVWSILGQFARAAGALVVAPQVTFVLIVFGLIAIAALYGLNRILELEERSSS